MIATARVVNARMAAARNVASYRANERRAYDPIELLARRCETLEAAVCDLSRLIADVDDLARHALAVAEAA